MTWHFKPLWRVWFSGATWSYSTGKMEKRACGAPSRGKPLTIISTGAVRTDSKCLERTASPSSKRYGGDILLATPNWMGLFSFARAIYLTLNNLGMLHSQQQRMEEARKERKEALKINRELDQKNTQTCLPNVAMMLNNPGMLHSPQQRMEEARKERKEALKINRELDQKNTQTCLPSVAMMLNNLRMLHSRQQPMEEARKERKEALKINRELDQKNTQTCLPDVAMMLNNLGMLHSPQHRMEGARKEYKDSLKIDRELTQKNP